MMMRTRGTGPRGPAAVGVPRGFTLIELMVAIVILCIGVLGLAATSGVVTRQIGGGAQQTLAATLAQGRLESFHSRDCSTLTSDSTVTRGMTEVWTRTNASRAVIITSTVTYTTPRGPRSHTYTSMIPCAALPI